MLSLSKWARLTGHRTPNFHSGEMNPEELMVISSDVHHMYPWVQLGQSFMNTGVETEVNIDPPVGGIVVSSVLLNPLSNNPSAGVVAAPVAIDNLKALYAGIYSVRFRIEAAGLVVGRKGLSLRFLPAGAVGINDRFPWGGSVQEIPLFLNGTNDGAGVSAQRRMYFPIPWLPILMSGDSGTLLDADVINAHISIENEYLLDELAAMESFGRP